MTLKLWRAGAATLAWLATAALAQPPVAPVRDVPTLLHGVSVPDPYHDFKDVKKPEVRAWMLAQSQWATQSLASIDIRDALRERITALASEAGDVLRDIRRMPGERYFYLKRARNERQFKLVMRQGLEGAERVLVDPEAASRKTGVPHAINYYQPSWDSRTLAYGMSAGGSEDASLYLMDVGSGRSIGQPVPRVHETALNWLPDSRSLTFTQLKVLKRGEPATDTYKDARVLWLRVGAAASAARPVFGPTVSKNLGLDRLDVGEVITAPGSPWAVARTTDTTVPEGKLFVAPLAQLGQPTLRWQPISTAADKISGVELQGDDLYLLTYQDAPRRKVLKLSLKDPVLARATLVVAEPQQGVLEGFSLTRSGLVAELRQGTTVVLRRHATGDTAGVPVPQPAGTAAWVIKEPAHQRDDLLLAITSWERPVYHLLVDGETSREVPLAGPRPQAGTVDLQVSNVEVPSHDGVLVPMTVLHRRGLALDGNNPVLVHGYAAYGFSETVHYSAIDQAWLERGGVLAYTNPRGSGVHGNAWYRAGFKTTKPNTWKDGIACTRWLIEKGYGSAATMGIMGTSAGGVFVGRATTEAPELYAAAIFDVGVMDAVRWEDSANGVTNISEFGTNANPEEFKALLAMSTYNNIRDGVAYPAVLLVHGMNDPRVDVYESAKTAARLQAATSSRKPVLLRLDLQAGHGVGSTASQRFAQAADIYAFLLWQMGKAKLKS